MLLRTLGDLALDRTTLRRPKPLLLLTYLAFEGATPRHRLAGLFFGDTKDPPDSLSTALKYLRQHPDTLEFRSKAVATRVECDAKLLLNDLEKNDPTAAVGRYQGPFLSTLDLSLNEELEEWVYVTREFLARSVRAALLRLAELKAAQGDVVRGAREAERAYTLAGAPELEPEEIERVYVLLAHGNSPRAADLRREAAEVGVTLAPVTKSGSSVLQAAPTGITLHNLPQRGTAFIGRDTELAEIAMLLDQGECRLVTLTGLGGIGKTRLALEAGWRALQDSPLWDSVHFTPLESITSSDRIPAGLARALELDFEGQAITLPVIIDAIGDRAVLIILDNFEHLLDGVSLVAELLKGCPNLKVLATSRERLNLEEEWMLPVAGLSVPSSAPTEDAPRQDAMRLFVQRAKRASLHFSLTRENAPHVVEICRSVGGSPLGIELAAAWVRMFSPEDIAREVVRDSDFLSTTSHSLAARHQSIRATFEHSWRLLKPREQAVLGGLSVFQEGFRREAASQIVGATLPVLASLVDKSLLRVTPSGRYDRHPLIYAYAQEKLGEPERQRLRRLHADYYLTLAEELDDNLRGAKDAQDLETMEQEHGNFRAALETLLGQDEDKALRLGLALGRFWEIRGYLHEGSLWLEKALDHHPDGPLTLTIRAKALAVLGRLEQLQGNLPRAESLLEEGLSLWRLIGNPAEIADSLNRLGTAALTKGDYPRAAVHFQEGLELYRALDDSGGVSALLNNLGELARCQNDFLAASEYYEASLALTSKIDNVRWKAIVLGNLGSARRDLGDFGGAEALLKESLMLKYEVRDEIGLSYCFAGLAAVSGELGALERAASLLGIVDALTTRTKHQLDLADRNDVARTLSRVRSQMDPVDLAAAQDSGRVMSLDEAVAYGLGGRPVRAAPSNPDDGTKL